MREIDKIRAAFHTRKFITNGGHMNFLAKALVGALLLSISHMAAAGLAFWTKGDLMIVHGKAEKSDVETLKTRLTPEIRYVVMRGAEGGSWSVAQQLAEQIEDAKVTTVAHGNCTSYVCAMMFMAGKTRQFSGVGRPENHYVGLIFHDSNYVTAGDQVSFRSVANWWQRHSKLSDSDLSRYHDSIFATQMDSPHDLKIFFSPSAEFSKGPVIHCSGERQKKGLQKYWVDCMSVKDATALSKGIITTEALFTHPDLREDADITPPAATTVAKIEDKPVARLSDFCVEQYKDFLRVDSPKAFVVSSNGGCYWYYATVFRPYKSALDYCKKQANRECRFYAIDDKVVFTPFEDKVAEAPQKPSSN